MTQVDSCGPPYGPGSLVIDGKWLCGCCIQKELVGARQRIALLERVIYECVSYRDINNSTVLTEELYNEILYKFEPDLEESE